MNHLEKLESYAVVSIATAAAILGGDGEPVSPGTVYRLVRASELELRGKGKVSTASLRRYLEEGPRQQPAPRASTSRRAAPTTATPGDWERLIRFPKGTPAELPERLRLEPKLPKGQQRRKG